MTRLRVRELEMINEYFDSEREDDGVVSSRSPEEDRAETERRRAERIALQAELEAENG